MKSSCYLLFAAWAIFLLAACGESGSDSTPHTDGDWEEDSPAETEGDLEDSEPAPSFTHEIITQHFDSELTGIKGDSFASFAYAYEPISVDPAFRHLLNFQITPMMPPYRHPIPSHGPLILYTDDLETIVFSPLDYPFITLMTLENNQILYGLEGDVDSVPAHFEHRFLFVRGQGINATVEEWGRLMREDHGAAIRDPERDIGLTHLGYWTDNGAYYYYKTEEGMTEEETMLGVMADLKERQIPAAYLQLDSWWYYKTSQVGLLSGGLIRWEPQTQMFPQGLGAFQERLQMPIVAHSRWFAVENDYREDYTFLVIEGEHMALPMEQGVFDRLLRDAESWGLLTYEQDWLVSQYWGCSHLRNAPGHAESWMERMDAAVKAKGLSMQLCMPAASNLLDSLDRETPLTVRTSVDYHASVAKEAFWPQFHIVNMIAWAMGLWPFKDNFQSNEAFGEAEALISSLSAGMVGVGDRIGAFARDLILATCREDGRLLKPDRPALPLDSMFLDHARPFTVATLSRREGTGTWIYLAAFHLASEHEEWTSDDRLFTHVAYEGQDMNDQYVWPEEVTDWGIDLAEVGVNGPVVAYDWREKRAWVAEERLDLDPRPHLYDHHYVVLAPIFDNGLSLIGETGKYVTLASQRFEAVSPTENGVEVTLAGAPGETVTLRLYDTRTETLLEPVTVAIGADGRKSATLDR